MPNLVDESTNMKTFFWKSDTKLKTLQNLFLYIGVSYKFALKSLKSLNRIFWSMEYWFKALESQIWLINTKPFFWESEANLETLQKVSPYIGVSYKFVLTFVKILNRILWVIPYWFKTLDCEIWSTNTKSFFLKNDAKLQTLQKLSPYIGVPYKFVLKSIKTLNRIF